jgi:hypothetical protein
MAAANVTESDGTKPNPPVLGSLFYLLLNLPAGIAGFTMVIVMLSVGVSTVIIWVGLPVLMLAVLLTRGSARLERGRVHAMLGTYVASPYRPLPEGVGRQFKTRFKDAATWKDMAYLVLLLPIGIAEFTLMVTFWSTSLWFLFLPVYWGFMPDDWYPVGWNHPIVSVDSTWEALPWAALGAMLLAVTVVLTKGLGTLHARYARAMLGPSRRRVDAMATATRPGWGMDLRTHVFPGV